MLKIEINVASRYCEAEDTDYIKWKIQSSAHSKIMEVNINESAGKE